MLHVPSLAGHLGVRDHHTGFSVSVGNDGVGVGRNVGIFLYAVVVVGTVVGEVVSLSQGVILNVGIVGDVLGEEWDGIDGSVVVTIVVQVGVLSTLFQVVLTGGVQLSLCHVGRFVGAIEGQVGGIRL